MVLPAKLIIPQQSPYIYLYYRVAKLHIASCDEKYIKTFFYYFRE